MAWCGQAALARPTPLRVSGAALGGPHGAVYFPSGTKGQQPWCSPRCGPPGEGRGASKPRSRVGAAFGVSRGTPHARIVTRRTRRRHGGLVRARQRADRAVPGRVAPWISGMLLQIPVPQCFHKKPERRGKLAAAGIEVVAVQGLAPIFQHTNKGAVGDLSRYMILDHECDPLAGDCCIGEASTAD